MTAATTTEEPKPRANVALVKTDNDDPSRALNAFSSAANFAVAQRIASALSVSTIIPKEYRDNIPNCLIAIEIAARIGASVFMVMQNLDIIHGRPSWRATFLIATVNASKRFTPLRFRWEGKAGTETWGCRAVAKDLENGEECIGSLITIGTARAEGWSTKPGSKWLTIPEQMLMYRAAAFWTRVYAPELSLGMQTADEVIDTTGDFVPERLPSTPASDVQSLEAKLRATPAPTIDAPKEPAVDASRIDWDAEAEQAIERVKAAAESKAPALLEDAQAAMIEWVSRAPAVQANKVIRFWNVATGQSLTLVPEGAGS